MIAEVDKSTVGLDNFMAVDPENTILVNQRL